MRVDCDVELYVFSMLLLRFSSVMTVTLTWTGRDGYVAPIRPRSLLITITINLDMLGFYGCAHAVILWFSFSFTIQKQLIRDMYRYIHWCAYLRSRSYYHPTSVLVLVSYYWRCSNHICMVIGGEDIPSLCYSRTCVAAYCINMRVSAPSCVQAVDGLKYLVNNVNEDVEVRHIFH